MNRDVDLPFTRSSWRFGCPQILLNPNLQRPFQSGKGPYDPRYLYHPSSSDSLPSICKPYTPYCLHGFILKPLYVPPIIIAGFLTYLPFHALPQYRSLLYSRCNLVSTRTQRSRNLSIIEEQVLLFEGTFKHDTMANWRMIKTEI